MVTYFHQANTSFSIKASSLSQVWSALVDVTDPGNVWRKGNVKK